MTQTAPEAIDVAGSGGLQRKGLCDYLIEFGKLSPANAERALRLQSEQDLREPIGTILVKLGYVTEHNVAECLAAQLALPLVEAKNFPDELPAIEQVSHRFLQNSKTLIVAEDDDHLAVVMADPLDRYVTHALGLLTGMVQAYIFSILAAVYIAAATRVRNPEPQGEPNQ